MNSVFNEFGVPNEAVNNTAYDIERLARDFFHSLAKEGYPISEIRAVGGVFVQAIDCCVAEAVMTAAHEKREEARRNAAPDLSEEEIALAKIGHKIMAIKAYRERTTYGLKESKDAIEAWMQDHLGTKNPAYQPEAKDETRNES